MKNFLNEIKGFLNESRGNLKYFIKWSIFSLAAGIFGGVTGACFSLAVVKATEVRVRNPWLLFLMPLAGLMIVFIHGIFNQRGNKGTNLVLEAVRGDSAIDRPIIPLMFVSTVLSHLVGASVGREGAALQMGGGIGSILGKAFHFDEKDRRVAVMAGTSALFAAVFGTPIAAAVFAIEVISVGIMYFSALVPCVFSAFIGYGISEALGTDFEMFMLNTVPKLSLRSMAMIILLGICCAITAVFFCAVMRKANELYNKIFKENYYLRILAASAIFIILTLLTGTDLYEGTSIGIIERSFEGNVPYEAFILKIIFTAIALGGKFKGGEIVPTFCIGAALGCTFGRLVGFSPELCAACGMAGLFVGVTNCPVSTLIISLEMMSTAAMPFYSVVIAVSFAFSGYTGLYGSQRIMYSKTKSEFINITVAGGNQERKNPCSDSRSNQ